MTKLIVMFLVVSGQSATTISGFNSLDACNAAKQIVEATFKAAQGPSSYLKLATRCLELPN